MFVTHKVVSQSGSSVRDAAISEPDIEPAKCGGNMPDEEAIEEANGRVSAVLSIVTARGEHELT